MSKIHTAFQNHKAFIAFLTAGDPSLQKTEEYILAMDEAGADLIEIGIPFSDPIAEGDVIQAANIRALQSGTTVARIFDMVRSIRKTTSVPLVFLTYINPVYVYGYEKFFRECQNCGVDGIIIPDLPYEERGEIQEFAAGHDVDVITLIAPTSEERIALLARDATGFIYLVSSMGVTGVRKEIQTDIPSIVRAIRNTTQLPIAIGFGISEPAQAKELAQSADGIIVGSAIVKIIEKYGENAKEVLKAYVADMVSALCS